MRRLTLALSLFPFVLAPMLLLALGLGNAVTEGTRVGCVPSSLNPESTGAVRVGTLNWRGASHYGRNPHPGERPPLERVPNMVATIAEAEVSIIGFQEFEPVQARAFLSATAGTWDIISGRVRGHADTRNAIAYQPAVWTPLEVRHVTISYGGRPVDIPLVKFAARAGAADLPAGTAPTGAAPTGAAPTGTALNGTEGSGDLPGSPPAGSESRGLATDGVPNGSTGGPSVPAVWVLNTHNPADAVGGSDLMRDATVRAQAKVLRDLAGEDPATPQLFVGDMNDRARFRQLFTAVADPGWTAANPADAQVDWILGNRLVAFTDTVIDTATNDGARRYTDHPFVHTTAWPIAPPSDTTATLSPGTAARTPGTTPSAAVSPSGSSPTESAAGCASPPGLGTGEIGGLVAARMQAMFATPQGLCALPWTHGAPCTYDNQCPKVVDALYGGPGVGRGYGNGQDVAQGIIDAGLAQTHGTGLDPLPPVGAVVSYNSGNGVGHVATYVGNGEIFGNDYGCSGRGGYGCVGFADIHAPAGSVTWALPRTSFDLGGSPTQLK